MCISLERVRARMLISLRKQQNVNYLQRISSKMKGWQITLLCNIQVSIHLHGRWSQKFKTLQIASICNKINPTWIADLCFNRSLLVGHYYVEIKKEKISSPEVKCCVTSREPELKSAESIILPLARNLARWPILIFFACTYHSRWHFKYKRFEENYLVEFL